jgi:hypothetical protein
MRTSPSPSHPSSWSSSKTPPPAAPGVAGALNHLGVEVASPDEVVQATTRLSGEGLSTTVEEQTTCCYAVQDKVWVNDPDGAPWEVYAVLADAPAESGVAGGGGCCGGSASPEAASSSEPVVAAAARCC